MTKTMSLIILALGAGVLAGPLKREGCAQTCFNGVNECGEPFGGCWNECDERPIFTAPICQPTITSESVVYATVTETAVVTATAVFNGTSLITVAPAPTLLATLPSPEEPIHTCSSGFTICIDYLAQCGDRNVMYGGCHDTCSSITYTPPPCTVPVITASYNTTKSLKRKTKTSKRPAASRIPCTSEEAYMCAPLDW